MTYDPKIHHRRSLLRGYDYSQPGNYYVTLCTQDKKHWFGEIVEGETRRNAQGDDVARCWLWLGFEERIRGSHHIFRKQGVRELINLQKEGNKAKVYQVRQVRRVLRFASFCRFSQTLS